MMMDVKELKIVVCLLLLGFCLLGLTSLVIKETPVVYDAIDSAPEKASLYSEGFNPIKKRSKKRKKSIFRAFKSAKKFNKRSKNPPIHGERSQLTAFLLCVLLGIFGLHRFYTGQIGWGILQLCSLGCCGIFVIIDLVLIIFNRIYTRDGHTLTPW